MNTKDPYSLIMDELNRFTNQVPELRDIVLSVGFLGLEAKRMRRALDEIAINAWEDANMRESEIVDISHMTVQ
jgi:hypothetical protein